MTSQFVGSAYLALSVFIILVLAQISQKPLCINSQVIEKLTMTDETSVYRCSVRKKVPYTTSFAPTERLLAEKILPFESWLNRFWNIKAPRIQVQLTMQPIVTQLQGKNLLIWDQNLKNTQQLEVEIAKNYLRSVNPMFFEKNDLALNSLADFVVKVWADNQALSFGGLSTYMAHQWWVAYNQLKVQDKYSIIKKLPLLVQNATVQNFNDPETKTYEQVVQLAQLFSKEKTFFTLLKSRNTFEENSLTASFDYLILMPQIRSGIFKQLSTIQNREPSLNLGAWDGKALYHIGSKSQISADSFNKLKVRHLIWESCDDLELRALLGVSADVQKLLVVRNCSPQNQPDYNQYMKKGIAGFAATHPQISFVQIDLPSLNMRKDELALQKKIFEQMAMQNNEHSAFLRLFGLQQLNWDQKLQIYVPKSNIDAIESFRILKTN